MSSWLILLKKVKVLYATKAYDILRLAVRKTTMKHIANVLKEEKESKPVFILIKR